jgi:hypothetical protein
MKSTPLLLVIAGLCFSASAGAGAAAEGSLGKCLKIIDSAREVDHHESIDDGERDYFEVDGFKIGQYKRGQGFIEKDGKIFILQNLRESRSPADATKVLDSDMAFLRSLVYSRSEGERKYYCIISPFGGLGSSGSFQKMVSLTSIESKLNAIDSVESKIMVMPKSRLRPSPEDSQH